MAKIPNISVPRYITTSAVQAVRAAVDDAVRLGLTWRLRPGTVGGSLPAQPESVPVRVDGDNSTLYARSMVGTVAPGQRVWCVQIPPAGIYVMGIIGVSQATPTQTVFTTSGTWTPPAGLIYARTRGVGGGGQGGGCAATAAGQVAEASGGSAGGYCESLLERSALGTSVTVTIGAGGTGGAAGANGNPGGTTSFGSFWTANGGGGGILGAATAANAASDAPAGGAASGGNLVNVRGSEGGNGRVITLVHAMFNNGAASHLGAEVNNATANTAGVAGQLYGSGASGSRRSASQAAVAGLAGSAGIVIVEEFYS